MGPLAKFLKIKGHTQVKFGENMGQLNLGTNFGKKLGIFSCKIMETSSGPAADIGGGFFGI